MSASMLNVVQREISEGLEINKCAFRKDVRKICHAKTHVDRCSGLDYTWELGKVPSYIKCIMI